MASDFCRQTLRHAYPEQRPHVPERDICAEEGGGIGWNTAALQPRLRASSRLSCHDEHDGQEFVSSEKSENRCTNNPTVRPSGQSGTTLSIDVGLGISWDARSLACGGAITM